LLIQGVKLLVATFVVIIYIFTTTWN
jgi:hypothetical protein